MARRLVSTVHVYRRDEQGNPMGSAHVFPAGSEPPDWAQAAITNPKAWGEHGSTPAEEQYTDEIAKISTQVSGGTAKAAQTGDGEPPTPPKGGKRATRSEWLQYATDSGVQVDNDASKEDIVAACEAVGVPVS